MDKIIIDKIIQWISENHEHHFNTDNSEINELDKCIDCDYPYVNSVELEKYIMELL